MSVVFYVHQSGACEQLNWCTSFLCVCVFRSRFSFLLGCSFLLADSLAEVARFPCGFPLLLKIPLWKYFGQWPEL